MCPPDGKKVGAFDLVCKKSSFQIIQMTFLQLDKASNSAFRAKQSLSQGSLA